MTPLNHAGHSRRLLDVPTALALCLLHAACSSSPETSPGITLLDFRTQNVERLHAGIMRLIGDDSAGAAVGGYVKAYEDGLERFLSVRSSTVASTKREYFPHGLIDLYQAYDDPDAGGRRDLEKTPLAADPAFRLLKDYLTGQRLGALARLREHHDSFAERGDMADAKMGVANAYIATTAMPSASDIRTITDLVEPMLSALTRPRP